MFANKVTFGDSTVAKLHRFSGNIERPERVSPRWLPLELNNEWQANMVATWVTISFHKPVSRRDAFTDRPTDRANSNEPTRRVKEKVDEPQKDGRLVARLVIVSLLIQNRPTCPPPHPPVRPKPLDSRYALPGCGPAIVGRHVHTGIITQEPT